MDQKVSSPDQERPSHFGALIGLSLGSIVVNRDASYNTTPKPIEGRFGFKRSNQFLRCGQHSSEGKTENGLGDARQTRVTGTYATETSDGSRTRDEVSHIGGSGP